jgi:uncharacterized repeat protein (TIGR03803 family)
MLSIEACRTPKDSSTVLRSFSKSILTIFPFAFFLMLMVTPYLAQATATEAILHSFTCGAADGCNPAAGVVLDSNGNLYGTTQSGGAYGGGVVFKLSTSGTLTILHSFNPSAGDGSYPQAGVVFGPDGNLYGTTYLGGTYGGGTVYTVTPSGTGTETVLYNFTGAADGCSPNADVVFDSEANLYSTALYCGAYGWGTVFKLSPSGSGIGTGPFTTLHGFTGGNDGGYPLAGLLLGPGSEGNLYGTTYQGGTHGFGTVFKVTSSGKETVLHSFNANGKDGFLPEAGLVPGSTGNVVGTTNKGGTVGVGTVFEVSVSGIETIIYSFKAGKDDGISPNTGLVTTGTNEGCGVTYYGGAYDLGTVYCGNTSGAETVLHNFVHNGKDGYNPNGPLALDKSGNLYGTTVNGGNGGCGVYGCGTVFKIVP